MQQLLDRIEMEKILKVEGAGVIYEEVPEEEELGELQFQDLDLALTKLNDILTSIQDPLEEVNLDTPVEPRVTCISSLLRKDLKQKIISLLHEYKDCFTWDYHKITGLQRSQWNTSY